MVARPFGWGPRAIALRLGKSRKSNCLSSKVPDEQGRLRTSPERIATLFGRRQRPHRTPYSTLLITQKFKRARIVV
jgi:hypothetical protein